MSRDSEVEECMGDALRAEQRRSYVKFDSAAHKTRPASTGVELTASARHAINGNGGWNGRREGKEREKCSCSCRRGNIHVHREAGGAGR